MQIQFLFKNFEPSEHLRKYARRRMEKLSRFFGRNPALEAQVTLSVDKFRHRADFLLTGEGINITAVEQSEDMYASIDLALDKLSAQVKKFIAKNRDQWRKARKDVTIDVFTEPVPEDESTITDRGDEHYFPKPMSPDEAAMQLDVKDYDFVVFRNSETDRINVIYLRKNGGFGLIDPGV